MSDDRLADIKEHLAYGSSGVLWYDDDCIGDIGWLVGEAERLREQTNILWWARDAQRRAKEVERLRGLLARLEWAGEDYVNFDETVSACLICSGRQEDGHASDCEWVAVMHR